MHRSVSYYLPGIQHFGLCLAILFGSLLFSSCENDPEVVKNLSNKNLGVEEAINVDINYTLGGKARAKLLSPRMLRVQDTVPYVEFPNTLHVDFFNDTAKRESYMDARYGKYIESQSRILLKDSVRFIGLKTAIPWFARNCTGTATAPPTSFTPTSPYRSAPKPRSFLEKMVLKPTRTLPKSW